VRLESIKPQTPRETEIRRMAHANAVLNGLTMREAVYEALYQWAKAGARCRAMEDAE